jgi:hypothetical protein
MVGIFSFLKGAALRAIDIPVILDRLPSLPDSLMLKSHAVAIAWCLFKRRIENRVIETRAIVV